MKWMVRLLSLSMSLAMFVCMSSGALAQSYPNQPIRIIVHVEPGGFTDIICRVVAEKLSESLGQRVLVDNRPGAGGNIGRDMVAKAAPDGYTILATTSGIAINASLYDKLPFDPLNDFAPVTVMGSTPFFLVVHPSFPAKSVQELIALAKSKPHSLPYASNGIGTTTHLAAVLLESIAGIDLIHIPYKGGAPAVTAVLSNEAPIHFCPIPTALPQIKAGKMRALGVSSLNRSKAMPDLPTLAESGVPGYDASPWYAIFVPVKTPKEIVTKLNTEIVKALHLPDVQARFTSEQGTDLVADTPEHFAAFYKEELAKWAKVVKASGARPE